VPLAVSRLPLLHSADLARPVMWSQGRVVSAGELMQKFRALAGLLPAGPYLVNLCEQRDHFIIAWGAALLREQTNLLPSSRAPGVVDEVIRDFDGSYRCDDAFVARAVVRNEAAVPADIAAEHLSVIAFTSGSTGLPKRQEKRWRTYQGSNLNNAARIRERLAPQYGAARPWIVATVPPQHMYGIETSVLLPLIGDMAVHGGRPLFPADVVSALAEVPEPRVLVTTPVHLRALVESGLRFPDIALVISATAPLDAAQATAVERVLNTEVLEMFGSTETCVFATRSTAREESWRPYAGITLQPQDEGTLVDAPWFEASTPLQDVIETQADGRFKVRGRNADMVEVAGKRASLADLTRRLLSVPGVEDAVVFQPEAAAVGAVRRVAALVVAPALTAQSISEKLSILVDPAFMPRPLVLVQALPRNELGKLPRDRLLASLNGGTAQ